MSKSKNQTLEKTIEEQILEKAYWNNLTIYGSQLTYELPLPEGSSEKTRSISVVSSPSTTREEIEQRLIELVKQYL